MPIPREHGAWAMLITSLVLGLAVAGGLNAPGFYLSAAALLIFTVRQPLSLLWRRGSRGQWTVDELRLWAVGILTGTAALGLLLLQVRGPGVLLFLPPAAVFFLLQLLWQRSGGKRSWPAEIVGVAGISLAAPAAYYAATGSLGVTGLSLWPVLFAYFAAGVVHVRRRLRYPGDRRRAGVNLMVQTLIAGAVLLSGSQGLVPFFLFLAFLPGVVKALADLARTGCQARAPVKRVGWAEVIYSLFFFFLVLAAYRV